MHFDERYKHDDDDDVLQSVMLLTVAGGPSVNRYRESASPSRRPPHGVRRRRTSDSDDDQHHHSLSPSPYRAMHCPAAASDVEPSGYATRRSTWPPTGEDVDAAGASPRRVAYSKQMNSSSSSRDWLSVPRGVDGGDRPHSCELATLTKPILAVDRCHDCSMETLIEVSRPTQHETRQSFSRRSLPRSQTRNVWQSLAYIARSAS